MNQLKDLLRDHYIPSDALGTGEVDRPALRAALTQQLTHLRTMFWIAAGMVIAVFVLEIAVLGAHLDSPNMLLGVSGAIGLTIAGSIEAIRRIAREMAQVSILILLSSELDSEGLSAVVGTLAKKL